MHAQGVGERRVSYFLTVKHNSLIEVGINETRQLSQGSDWLLDG